MKKIFLLVALVPFLVASSAMAAPPKFVDTAAYKSLQAYVSELNSKKTTPVTSEEKTALTSSLEAKVDAAKTRSNELFEARKNYRYNQNQKDLKRVYKKYDRKYQSRAQLIEKNLKIDYRQLGFKKKDRYRALNREYRGRENRLKSQLSSLRRRYYDASSASQKTSLQRQINAKIIEIANLDKKKEKDIKNIEKGFKSKRAALKKEADRNKRKAKRFYNRKKSRAKSAYGKNYQKAKRSYIQRKDKEHEIVNNLRDRGQSYIDEMPISLPPVT